MKVLEQKATGGMRKAGAGSPSPCGRGLGGGVNTAEPGDAHPSPYPLPQGERENNSRDDRLVLSDWNSELGSWQRVKTDGHSIEAVCAELGLSSWKLTQLTKEYCNLTATEVFDGHKVKQLKSFILARLKEAAQQLWKNPGEYAAYKAQGYVDCQSGPLSRSNSNLTPWPPLRLTERGRKASRFFPTKPQDLFVEEKWAEKARRTTALIEKMWEEFDFESWALSAGYSTVRRLKRAVLTVLGKTFEQMEKCLAGEVIEYYQCAEDRELRNLALGKDCDAVVDARRLYHKSSEKPAEPFLDMWSAAEFAAKDWLMKMAGAFG